MKASLCRLAILITGATAILLAAPAPSSWIRAEDKPAADDKPAPDWVKMIDQSVNDPRLKGYQTPEGIKVEIVAEDPVLVSAGPLVFADDGTPYVLESHSTLKDPPFQEVTFQYKDGSKRRAWAWSRSGRDVVKALVDAKGKGVYDESRVVLEDETPSGLFFHDGWLYLCGRGTVRRYKQSKGEGAYDVKQVVAQGFGGLANPRGGMTVGPDGWLYVMAGDGDHVVEGSDGSRATALRTGALFRCKPDGSNVETYATGFVNPSGDVSFDAVGNLFGADGGVDEADGSFKGDRLMYVVAGADFGWRSLGNVVLQKPADFRSPRDPIRAAAAGGRPGVLSPMLRAGSSGSGGLLIYNGTRFPQNYRGLFFAAEASRHAVRAYKVRRNGAAFEVMEGFGLLASDDLSFQPSEAVFGPDGAVYVVDPHPRAFPGNPALPATKPRIYRLTWAGTKDQPALPPRGMDSWAKINQLGDDDLVQALASDDGSDRDHARQELARRGEKNRPALLKLLNDVDQPEPAREAALGALESMWNGGVQAAVQYWLRHGGPDLRRLCADALGLNATRGDDGVHAALLAALVDADPAVRRSAALAMSHVAADGAADNLVNTWANDDGRDRYLSDGLVRAIENLGPAGMDRLVALGESGVEKDTDKVVQAFTMMRTKPAADAIPRVLENPHLKAGQRAAVIRSYENYLLDPPLSLAPMVDYLTAHPDEDAAVKAAGAEALGAGGATPGDKAVGWLIGLFDEKDAKLRTSAVSALTAIGVGPEDARRVGQAFLDGKLPAEAQPQVADILHRHAENDAECARLLKATTNKK